MNNTRVENVEVENELYGEWNENQTPEQRDENVLSSGSTGKENPEKITTNCKVVVGFGVVALLIGAGIGVAIGLIVSNSLNKEKLNSLNETIYDAQIKNGELQMKNEYLNSSLLNYSVAINMLRLDYRKLVNDSHTNITSLTSSLDQCQRDLNLNRTCITVDNSLRVCRSHRVFTYNACLSYCGSLGGDVVTSVIRNQTQLSCASWIGVKWNSSSGRFRYKDNNDKVLYSWASGEPNHGNKAKGSEPCVQIKSTAKLNDVICDKEINCLCQIVL